MRILMLGAAAIALSGCSFLGLGGQKDYSHHNAQTGYYGQPVAKKAHQPRCHSGNCLARWNLEGGIGPTFAAGKNVVTASRTNENDATTFNSVSFGDAYETGVRAELGGSYALAPNTKVSVLGHYEQADSEGVQTLGSINGNRISGSLSDYEQFGAEIGLRQYFQPAHGIILDSVRPYVEARAGVARVDDISIRNARNGDRFINNGTVPFYEDSWVPTGAALVGIETPVARYTTIGLETGVRFQGGLKTDDSVLAPGTALAGLNNNSGRVSVPITLRGRYRF